MFQISLPMKKKEMENQSQKGMEHLVCVKYMYLMLKQKSIIQL